MLSIEELFLLDSNVCGSEYVVHMYLQVQINVISQLCVANEHPVINFVNELVSSFTQIRAQHKLGAT